MRSQANSHWWQRCYCGVGKTVYEIFSGKGKKLIHFRVTTHALLDEIVPASAPPPLAALL